MLTGVFLFSPSVTLLSTCEAFRWDSAKLLSPLGSPVGKLLQYEGSGQGQLIQDSGQLEPSQRLYRTKRHRELVRTQPHLVHHMAVPEIEESSRANARVKPSSVRQGAARTRVEENLKVEEEMEVKITRARVGVGVAQGPVQHWHWVKAGPFLPWRGHSRRCRRWFWKCRGPRRNLMVIPALLGPRLWAALQQMACEPS